MKSSTIKITSISDGTKNKIMNVRWTSKRYIESVIISENGDKMNPDEIIDVENRDTDGINNQPFLFSVVLR